MIMKDKKLINKDLRIEKAKLELEIDLKELGHILHKEELPIIGLI